MPSPIWIAQNELCQYTIQYKQCSHRKENHVYKVHLFILWLGWFSMLSTWTTWLCKCHHWLFRSCLVSFVMCMMTWINMILFASVTTTVMTLKDILPFYMKCFESQMSKRNSQRPKYSCQLFTDGVDEAFKLLKIQHWYLAGKKRTFRIQSLEIYSCLWPTDT